MAQYTKHNSNYIKTVEHQHLKDGSTIFERDWVTIGSQLNFGPGKIPYYNDGNFIFTSNPTPFYQKRYKNGVTVATWTYDDVKEATATVNQIEFDEYTEDIRSFVYYGSCVELLRATIEKIIFEFPGNITLSEDRLEIPPTTEEGDYTYINGYIVNNPFQIDLHTKDVHLQQYDNELHFLSYSWQKYEVNGQPITSYVISDWMGDLDCPQNDQYYIKKAPVVTVTINGNIVLKGYKSDRDIIFCYEGQDLVIQPKEEVIEEYFKSLKGFEKQLLTRKTKPLYTNKFITPIEYNLGYLYYNRTYTWPSDGYCIDITSTKYIDFINKLSDMAELYDELWTDNLWRRMTHEAIKNYDWTYTREFIEGDEEDNVDGGERMHKVLNIIGRVFDDIKLSIDTIKRQNKTTYNGDRNVPNALLSDKLELFGWDIYSTIPTYKNENDETVSASEEIITQEVLDNIENEVEVNGKKIYPDKWYPTSNPNKITFADADVEFMRRLLLSTRRIFETKGTRQSIDMIMGLFGYGDTDYTITEHYRTVTPREYDEVIDQETNETLGDRIVRLNNQEKQMELLYDEDASGIPVASFIGGYDEQGNPKTYLIPYYDQTKMYDGNLYFQNKGGWLYKKDDESTEIDFSKWTETLSYLHVVSQVKDLMNVNPFEIKNGDIYYVVNLNDYIDYTETTDTLYSHFFALKNELMPEEFSSWVNINLEDGFYEGSIDYTDEEATLYDSYAKKAKYLETIIPYNIGNNPHVGYGEYDMGNEFFEYMKKPFKYALDKYYFTSPYYEEANEIEFYGLDRKDAQYDIENEDDNDKKIKRINNNDTYYLNDKVIIFKNNINNDEYKKYFKAVIINYLMQIIPSTAIFVLENFALNGNKDEDDSDKFSVTFKFNNGSQRTVKIKGGASVNCPSNTKWNLQGGGNTIYEQGNGFPYIVNQDTTFIEYVIVYYTVRFYDTEGGQLIRTDSIEGGKTVNESGQWYRLGDANKAQVTFPYTVNSNVDFVRLVKFNIKWYENADDTNPTTQQVTRGDIITALESGQSYYRKNNSRYTIVSFPIRAQQNEEFVKVTTYTVKWYQSEDNTNPEIQTNIIYGQSVTKSGYWCLMSSPQTIASLPYRITQDTEFVKYTAPITYYTVRYFENESSTQTLYEQSVAEQQKTTNPNPNISWYVRGDSNKTQIDFSTYVVNESVDFIKIPEYTVNWIDNSETN